MMIDACNKGIFKGLSLANDGANISFLKYADDALFMEVETIARSINYFHDSFPFSYLGLPVGRSMGKVEDWACVSSKYTKRLTSWKNILLSIGGRSTLTKFVLDSAAAAALHEDIFLSVQRMSLLWVSNRAFKSSSSFSFDH
uniref:RNA-directed DNA polymerase, eukaryota n=1 Tax=Tanacetum cinerariifolium TaxID=118510 RepID=A0A699I6H2_TANCI|nr:RNA-directed DNA polymerase, eukaryota [Tanacetum cinerariifolium]